MEQLFKTFYSDITFDEISSIKAVGEQHVYDLSIEGTRNFIANDIVAHNTYLATSSGNVGIGTTSPGAKLQVEGSAEELIQINGTGVSGAIYFRDSGTFLGTIGYGDPGTIFTGGDSDTLRIRSENALHLGGSGNTLTMTLKSGNVGIGTTAPQNTLHVNGTGFLVTNTTGTANVFMFNATTGKVGIGTTSPKATLNVVGDVYHNLSTVSQDFNIVNATGNSRFFVDNSNGNVGIGTTGPVGSLHIEGGVAGGKTESLVLGNAGITDGSGTALYMGYQGGGLGLSGARILQTGNPTSTRSSDLSFQIHGTPADNLDSSWNTALFIQRTSGNVGINDTTPTETLDVTGTLSVKSGQSGNAQGLYQNPSGRVGIGTTSPAQTLTVQGRVNISQNLTVNNSVLFVDGTSGNVGIGTDTPTEALVVAGNTNVTGNLIVGADGSGNVGIGVTSPSERLTLRNGSFFQEGGNASAVYLPKKVGGTDTSDDSQDIAVSGRYAYVVSTSTTDDLEIFDIYNRSNPTKVGGVALSANGLSIAVSGDYAYVTSLATGDDLEIVDVSNPANPIVVGGVDAGEDTRTVKIAGRYVFIATDEQTNDEFQIFDVSDPSSPNKVGSGDVNGSGQSVDIHGKYAYVVSVNTSDDTGEELEIFDISDVKNPVRVGTANTSGNANGVSVSGLHAYIAVGASQGSPGTLEIFDISNVSNVVKVGEASIADYGRNLKVHGRYAYVTSGTAVTNSGDLEIFDVSDPTNPVKIGGVSTSDIAWSVVLSGKYAYTVGDNNAGGDEMEIFDITGIEAQSAVLHTLEAGNIHVINDLTVAGHIFADSARFGLGGLLADGPASLGRNGSLNVDVNGNVGIGTTAPNAKLVVIGGANISGGLNVSAGNVLLATESGNVGINSTTPTKTLHVVGTGAVCDTEANCDSASATIGNLYATTRTGGTIDIAELIKFDGEKPIAGDLLCIAKSSSIENKGVVEKCGEDKSRLVIGVVTTEPHMVIGQELKGEDAIEMTISGRTPINVVGEVKIGDLLTASNNPGSARACKLNENCEGAIVGKSLTNAKDGKVIALTALQ